MLRQHFFFILITHGLIFNGKGATGTPMVKPREAFGPPLAVALDVSATSTRDSIQDRPTCYPVDTKPPVRVNTTQRVANLRAGMSSYNVDAYIVPNGDAHQSEYVASADERRRYISGFSGSAGTAVITMDKLALWTDGRYFLQAEDELDCNWILMKELEPGVPTILEWLTAEMTAGQRVSADATLIGSSEWLSYQSGLTAIGVQMIEIPNNPNLVDEVWDKDDRPPYVQDEVFIHEIKYAGKAWEDKIEEVRLEMTNNGADMIIFTALDEIAWLLNLRGNDIPYNPVFRSYVTVTATDVNLFISLTKVNDVIRDHLAGVNIRDYDIFLSRLGNNNAKKVMIPDAYSYAGGASYAVYSRIKESARMLVTSPVLLKKAIKNNVELQGMKNAHLRDAVALCDFLSFLEKEIKAGNHWTEISAATKLAKYRAQQEGEKGLSFSTISGFGSNGAIIHYEPTPATDKTIDTSSLYLLDSGGQYFDGTTDVTRTMHYGTPTPLMIETYTRVLMGHIDLAMAVFPDGTMDTRTDITARLPLYKIGLDYNHGTGHGIGMFLGVHEAPIQVRIYGYEDHPFRVGYFLSDEPGYYQDGDFGIRLENIMTVVQKSTPYNFHSMVGFETVTLVPYEANLIDTTLLDEHQCNWLNSYHATVREKVGAELKRQNRNEGYEWLVTKTEPVCTSAASIMTPIAVLLVGVCMALKNLVL